MGPLFGIRIRWPIEEDFRIHWDLLWAPATAPLFDSGGNFFYAPLFGPVHGAAQEVDCPQSHILQPWELVHDFP